MRSETQAVRVIDYRQANAVRSLLPNPSILSSSGWQEIHLELFEQPAFEIPEHQHTMHVIACAPPHLRGKPGPTASGGERWLAGKLSQELRNEGDIAIIPADMPHRCNWSMPVEFMVLAIEPALLQRMGQDWVNPDHIELMPRFMNESDALLWGIFTTLRAEVERGKMGGPLLVDSLKSALAIHLLRQYCVTSPKVADDSGGLSPATLHLVTAYVQEHLQQNLTLMELAAVAHISPYHFSHLFKQSLGISPHQYILRSRLEKAKMLLQKTNLSIAEIAISVGFCDQSHLTRYFKRILGVTPKQFRQS